MIYIALICTALALWPWLDTISLPAELLGQARLHMTLLTAIMVVVAVVRKSWAAATILMCVVVANLLWIERAIPLKHPVSKQATITVLTHNIWKFNPTPDAAIVQLEASDADLIWIQEVTIPLYKQLVDALNQRYPYHTQPQGFQKETVSLLFSRYPITSYNLHATSMGVVPPFGQLTHYIRHAELEIDQQKVHFIGLHLLSPRSVERVEARNQQLIITSEYIQELRQNQMLPIIVAGDMNTATWRVNFQHFLEQAQLMTVATFEETPFSWPAWLPRMLQVPIDHILVSKELCPGDITTLSSAGSDHHPLYAELTFCH